MYRVLFAMFCSLWLAGCEPSVVEDNSVADQAAKSRALQYANDARQIDAAITFFIMLYDGLQPESIANAVNDADGNGIKDSLVDEELLTGDYSNWTLVDNQLHRDNVPHRVCLALQSHSNFVQCQLMAGADDQYVAQFARED